MDPHQESSSIPNISAEPDAKTLPVIDISALVAENPTEEALKQVAQAINEACRNWGFFYIINHGVCGNIQKQVETLTEQFFALPEEKKTKMSITKSGKAWRGYFPLNSELTSGKPDLKEGIYMGRELPETDARVQAGLPWHGSNLWPDNEFPEMKSVMLKYMDIMEKLGRTVMKGIALSLGLAADYFEVNYLKDPSLQFCLFNYPPDIDANRQDEPRWGVREHCDYGLLTILKQDNSGGLQVKSCHHGWTEAIPIHNAFLCNLGDMLQAVTNGLYLSTPHRVRNVYTGRDRMSYPFFLDPSWDADIEPLPLEHLGIREVSLDEFVLADASRRWDKTSPQTFRGKYGDYMTRKMSKLFPDLKQQLV